MTHKVNADNISEEMKEWVDQVNEQFGKDSVLRQPADLRKLIKGLKMLIQHHPDPYMMCSLMNERIACTEMKNQLWKLLCDMVRMNNDAIIEGSATMDMTDHLPNLEAMYSFFHGLERGFLATNSKALFEEKDWSYLGNTPRATIPPLYSADTPTDPA